MGKISLPTTKRVGQASPFTQCFSPGEQPTPSFPVLLVFFWIMLSSSCCLAFTTKAAPYFFFAISCVRVFRTLLSLQICVD